MRNAIAGFIAKHCDGTRIEPSMVDGRVKLNIFECRTYDNLRECFLNEKRGDKILVGGVLCRKQWNCDTGEFDIIPSTVTTEKVVVTREKDADGEFKFDPVTLETITTTTIVEKKVDAKLGKGKKKTLCPECRKWYARFNFVRVAKFS